MLPYLCRSMQSRATKVGGTRAQISAAKVKKKSEAKSSSVEDDQDSQVEETAVRKRMVYITDRHEINGRKLRMVDPVTDREQAKEQLEAAKAEQNWKKEAAALRRIALCYRWMNDEANSQKYLALSSAVCRKQTADHLF